MTPPAADFLKHLEASGLVAREETSRWRRLAVTENLDAEAIAVRLVQQGQLTAYQAKQLLAGRYS